MDGRRKRLGLIRMNCSLLSITNGNQQTILCSIVGLQHFQIFSELTFISIPAGTGLRLLIRTGLPAEVIKNISDGNLLTWFLI